MTSSSRDPSRGTDLLASSKPGHSRLISPDVLLKCVPLDNNKKYKCLTFANPFFEPSYPTSTSHSSLQTIPVELYQDILSHLSIQDLTNFRRASQYTRSAIDGILIYQDLVKFAPSALRACLATCTASNILIRQLHHTLTNPRCFFCFARYASLLSLFTGNRVCEFCLRNDPSLQPYEVASLPGFSLLFGLMAVGKVLHTVPGCYICPDQSHVAVGRVRLFLRREITEEKLAILENKMPRLIFGDSNSIQAKARAKGRHSPFVHPTRESDISPLSDEDRLCTATEARERDRLIGLRNLTVIEMPYFDPKTKEIRTPKRCVECIFTVSYLEAQWKSRRDLSINRNGSGIAPTRLRRALNHIRANSCVFYLDDDLAEHLAKHHGNELSVSEKGYREIVKATADAPFCQYLISDEDTELMRASFT